jgi:L-asparaginase II
MGVRIIVERGGLPESCHRVHVAVATPEGCLVARAGDPEAPTFLRSAAKPFQALPLVEEGVAEALGLTSAELAVACASHNGEPEHLREVASLLAKAGCSPEDLECGPHPPMDAAAARALESAGQEAARIHNNCSGKHAGMLALARHHGWPVKGYRREGHPVQDRMLGEVSRWTGVPGVRVGRGVDGCGVVCFSVPLRTAARGIAAFARAGARGEPAGEVVRAMTAHPFLVAGTGRLCTELMEATGGRIVAKVGAEGVYVAATAEGAVGVALKVEDGARRALEPALVAVLHELGLLSVREAGVLGRLDAPIRNTLGEEVGVVRAIVDLQGRSA